MLVTRQTLLRWLRSIEDDGENPERHNALWDGSRLLTAARSEHLPLVGPQGQLDFTRLLGQLKEDGWITWTWVQWPAGTRDADEPPARFLAAEHLSRIQEVRVLPFAYRLDAAPTPSAQGNGAPKLEPEQEQLLVTLTEACRDVPRGERVMLDPYSITLTGSLALEDLKQGVLLERGAWQSAIGDHVRLNHLTGEDNLYAGVRGAGLAMVRNRVYRQLGEIVDESASEGLPFDFTSKHLRPLTTEV